MSREEHIYIINRFHNAIDNIEKQIVLGDTPENEADLKIMLQSLKVDMYNDIDKFTEEINNNITKILQ